MVATLAERGIQPQHVEDEVFVFLEYWKLILHVFLPDKFMPLNRRRCEEVNRNLGYLRPEVMKPPLGAR